MFPRHDITELAGWGSARRCSNRTRIVGFYSKRVRELQEPGTRVNRLLRFSMPSVNEHSPPRGQYPSRSQRCQRWPRRPRRLASRAGVLLGPLNTESQLDGWTWTRRWTMDGQRVLHRVAQHGGSTG